MAANCKLLVRKLPQLLKKEEKEDLLKQFGATSVEVLPPKGHMRNCAFVTFLSTNDAQRAMFQLHQLQVLGSRLVVEYAHDESHRAMLKEAARDKWKCAQTLESRGEKEEVDNLKLEHAVAVRDTAQEPETTSQTEFEMEAEREDEKQIESSESELSSDEETREMLATQRRSSKPSVPSVRKVTLDHLKKSLPPSKIARVTEERERDEDVAGEGVSKLTLPHTEITLHIPTDWSASGPPTHSQVGSIAMATTAEVTMEKEVDEDTSKWREEREETLKHIRENSLTDEERQELAVFRSYHPGDPSPKLYIKNLARSVTEEDLRNVYSMFEQSDVDQPCSIKLMTSGRMKGQAFVSYSSIEEAAEALKVTNGYKLQEKPIVVYFSRS